MIKPKSFQLLTWAVFNAFCNRKQEGYISVVTDTETKKIYPIPLDEEHKTFVPRIIGLGLNDMMQDPMSFSRFVPTLIATAFDEVIGVRTGFSGMESGFGVRHTREQFNLAHNLVKAFIELGEVPKSNNFKDWGIDYRYAM